MFELEMPQSAMRRAEGVYTHFVQSEEAGTREKWSLFCDDDVDYLQIAYGSPVNEVEAIICVDAAGRIQRLVYQMKRQGQLATSGDYDLRSDALYVQRQFAPATQLEDRVPYSGQLVLDPPFISSKGYTLATIDDGVRHPTFAPLLTLGERAGDLAKKSAKQKGHETLYLLEAERHLHRVEYGYEYWVDDANIVWRALATAHDYEIVLTEFTSF